MIVTSLRPEPDRLIGHQTSRLIEHISSIRIPTLISETEWRATTLNAAGPGPDSWSLGQTMAVPAEGLASGSGAKGALTRIW